METPFLVMAVAGGTVLLLQFLAGLLGIGSDFDTDHDLDHDAGTHSDEFHGSNWFAGLLTLRTITIGFTFFGLVGMTALHFGQDDGRATILGALGGVAALYGVSQLMLGIKKLTADGSSRIERTVGLPATVYLTIPEKESGPGKITIVVQKHRLEYAAFTTHPSPLATGAKVRVVAVKGPASVLVEPAES